MYGWISHWFVILYIGDNDDEEWRDAWRRWWSWQWPPLVNDAYKARCVMSVTSRKILFFMSTTTAAENVPNLQSPGDIKAMMKARVDARITTYEKSKEKAEELKTNVRLLGFVIWMTLCFLMKTVQGNELFKSGDYEEAAKIYLEAYSLNFTEVNYLSNFAAALMKMERWAPTRNYTETVRKQLTIGIAMLRHGQPLVYKFNQCTWKLDIVVSRLEKHVDSIGAHSRVSSAATWVFCFRPLTLLTWYTDAKALLRIDPSCPEAKKEIKELRSQLQLNEYDDSEDELDDSPDENHDVPTFSPEDWSDSEDAQMTGNGIPCRHYNHLGCLRGPECKFSHAQDDFCVRDRL